MRQGAGVRWRRVWMAMTLAGIALVGGLLLFQSPVMGTWDWVGYGVGGLLLGVGLKGMHVSSTST